MAEPAKRTTGRATPKKPKLAPAPEPAEANLEETWTLYVGENAYPLTVAELTAKDVGEFRRQAQMSVTRMARLAFVEPDLDVFAGWVWLSRRQQGETTVSYDAVASSLKFNAEYRLEEGPPKTDDEEDDLPSP